MAGTLSLPTDCYGDQAVRSFAFQNANRRPGAHCSVKKRREERIRVERIQVRTVWEKTDVEMGLTAASRTRVSAIFCYKRIKGSVGSRAGNGQVLL